MVEIAFVPKGFLSRERAGNRSRTGGSVLVSLSSNQTACIKPGGLSETLETEKSGQKPAPSE